MRDWKGELILLIKFFKDRGLTKKEITDDQIKKVIKEDLIAEKKVQPKKKKKPKQIRMAMAEVDKADVKKLFEHEVIKKFLSSYPAYKPLWEHPDHKRNTKVPKLHMTCKYGKGDYKQLLPLEGKQFILTIGSLCYFKRKKWL